MIQAYRLITRSVAVGCCEAVMNVVKLQKNFTP